jgi:hypothetical protein
MKRGANIAALLAVVSSVSGATAPLNEVVVTPKNEREYDFSISLSGRSGPRTFVVYAPDRVKGDCVLGFSIAELKTTSGIVIYSQSMELAPTKKLMEIRTEIGDPAHVLKLSLNYYCPGNHVLDGTQYVFSSADWQSSGRMQ